MRPDQALSGLLRPVPRDAAGKTVLLAGAVGRIGERVLNALLASSALDRVHVLTALDLPSTESKLGGVRWPQQDALPQVDTAVLCVAGSADEASDPVVSGRSYYGRDKAYQPLTTDGILPLAEALAQQGTRRLILVSPTAAHLQSMVFSGMVHGDLELRLAFLFETLVVIRPGAAPASARGGNLGERTARWVFQMLRYMVPQSLQPADSRRVAAAVVEALERAPMGAHVIDTQNLQATEQARPLFASPDTST